jgi:hypothetical protein
MSGRFPVSVYPYFLHSSRFSTVLDSRPRLSIDILHPGWYDSSETNDEKQGKTVNWILCS